MEKKKGRPVRIVVLLTVLWSFCCALPAYAGSVDELTPYLSSQYFTWREFSGGRRLLKESGALFAGGGVVELLSAGHASSSLALRGRGEIFGGVVNYDGQTQDQIPVTTEVGYFGTRQELDLGYRHSAASWNLEPFGGVGYRWWLRMLQDSTSATGTPVSGYTEYWQTGYLRLGARARFQPASGVALFAEGGAKYPFFTSNSADPLGTGVNTFSPGGNWSGFAETGITYRHLRVALSYEGFRFSSSPVIPVDFRGKLVLLHQPESASDIFGLNIGWSF